LSRRAMIAAVWIGLHLLVVYFWFQARHWWFGWRPDNRLQVLHALGLSYLLLRLIAWGVELARDPHVPLRIGDTCCWLLYPPALRNGPVLLRQDFMTRLAAWTPQAAPPARQVGARLLLAGLGLMALIGANRAAALTPPGTPADYFAAPQLYSTGGLLRVFYCVPAQAYFFLWAYSELAVALGLWVGIPVDENFDHLPTATSVREFWRRWNITVGAWLRNYIYIPIGGNRRFAPLAFMAVFGYCALWHGPSWSFMAWAVSQAAALSVQRPWDRWRARQSPGYWVNTRAWTVVAWLLTMHYQVATIVVFSDFTYAGSRFFPELIRRLTGR
jgi:alginate O-acetyltransferase complex protein AlgI